ncbi:MAG: radical SAM protein [Deltaproteobacteria bacterium]|nr:radical SAM protein [Deltaproteobacteria bacterium]
MKVRLHAIEYGSRANGPGLRAALWFQGCTLACPGCFNPATHDAQDGGWSDTGTLAAEISARRTSIEGVSISGGEPFQQPQALRDLLERLAESGLSRLVFSGYTLHEIQVSPWGPAILSCIDVLIAGRYVAMRGLGEGLRGSANQRVHLLTSRYTHGDLAAVPRREVILHPDGSVSITGIRPAIVAPEAAADPGAPSTRLNLSRMKGGNTRRQALAGTIRWTSDSGEGS